jgi:hypothetical protein
MYKKKDYLTKKCAGSGTQKNFIPDPDLNPRSRGVKKHRIPGVKKGLDPGSGTMPVPVALVGENIVETTEPLVVANFRNRINQKSQARPLLESF